MIFAFSLLQYYLRADVFFTSQFTLRNICYYMNNIAPSASTKKMSSTKISWKSKAHFFGHLLGFYAMW